MTHFHTYIYIYIYICRERETDRERERERETERALYFFNDLPTSLLQGCYHVDFLADTNEFLVLSALISF